MITKESGKMLGTLVALAVARMINLETFIWDMPTGVLRDVWLALSSLQDKSPPGHCRLERVLVRWHDNYAVEPGQTPPASTTTNTSTTPHNPTAGSALTDVGYASLFHWSLTKSSTDFNVVQIVTPCRLWNPWPSQWCTDRSCKSCRVPDPFRAPCIKVPQRSRYRRACIS
jgi:hypothetical protein